MLQSLLPLTALAALATAHGLVETPLARAPGAATAAVCGQNMVDFYNSDPTSYPEALMRGQGWDQGWDPAACDHFLCKGFQFEDNADNVQEYTAGQEVDFGVFIRIPHVGYANVSVVDTASNAVVGEALKVWEDGYADGAVFPDLPVDQTNFTITIPELDGQCAEPGACVSFPCRLLLQRGLWETNGDLVRVGHPVVLVWPGPDLRVLRRLHHRRGRGGVKRQSHSHDQLMGKC